MKTSKTEKTSSKTRVARMVNALTFAVQSFRGKDNYSDPGRRQLQDIHAVWLLGGYLYEAIHLVDDLSSAYGRSQRFKELEKFAKYITPYRDVMAEFNISPSFTMDWGGDVTRKIIESKPDPFFVTASQSLDDHGVMYPGVFTLDVEYFRDKTDNLVSEEELNGLIKHGLVTYAEMFIDAAVKFIGERLPDEQIPVEPSPQPNKPLTLAAVAPKGGNPSGSEGVSSPAEYATPSLQVGSLPESDVDPETMAKIFATCDPNEVDCRVPICFGGNFDPDACGA